MRLVYHLLSVPLDCPFLIAPVVFSNVYLSCVLCTKMDNPEELTTYGTQDEQSTTQYVLDTTLHNRHK
jgi:hypothetical protein